jgi:hypothetical protein
MALLDRPGSVRELSLGWKDLDQSGSDYRVLLREHCPSHCADPWHDQSLRKKYGWLGSRKRRLRANPEQKGKL